MLPQNKPIRETSSLMPTLSTQGWISGMNEKVDRSFAYYITSQYSQTLHHLGHIASLQYTIKNHMSDPFFLCQKIKEDLTYLLQDYIDYVDIKVTCKEIENTGKYNYYIDMDLVHAGYKWQQFKGIHMTDSKFEELIRINNEGVSLG